MKLQDAKYRFIQAWGSLGSSWGISKSMAQIHALLLSSHEGMTADDIMEQVKLSRGNVNTNVRELINWRLVRKENRLGERKEYFVADHDIYRIAQHILDERHRREIEPVRDLLFDLKNTKIQGNQEDVKHFNALISDLEDFVGQMENLLKLVTKINNNNFLKKMIKSVS